MADETQERHLAAIGVGGRLASGAGTELADVAGRLEAGDAALLDAGLAAADLAHAIVLIEAGVVPAATGARLLRLLLDLRAVPPGVRPADARLGDGFANREAWLAERDPEAAGWLCAGRARREGTTVAYHLAVRERLAALAGAVIDVASALVAVAERHCETLMPDYTYLQPAQPTTLGHYLLGTVYALRRDVARLQGCYERANACPAGVGSVNGARLPVDRRRLADLLGFTGLVTHARDAMWQADHPVEVMSSAATVMLALDRLAEDLQVWSTAEFALVEVADRHARGSMVMPQKKNPYALAFVRGVASTMVGELAQAVTLGRTPSGQVDNRIFVYGRVPRALDQVIATAALMAGVVSELRVDTERMARRVREGGTQATDLAEALAVTRGVSYRTAHRVVGRAVRLALERGLTPAALSPDLLDEAAVAVGAEPFGLGAAVIAEALDPARGVAGRAGIGGAAPSAVREMVAECRATLAAARRWCDDARAHAARAARALEARAQALAAPVEALDRAGRQR
jgi:argininosuccinate lyase